MGTHPIFESDFDCLTETTKMNRILARRMTLSAPRAGGLPKRTEPKFAVNWVHPSKGSALMHPINEECATHATLNYWRANVVNGPFGARAGQVIAQVRFFVWAALFFSVPFLSLGHNAYKRFGSPYGDKDSAPLPLWVVWGGVVQGWMGTIYVHVCML